MAIKDQCQNCKRYSEMADVCGLHSNHPSYDHRSCVDYVSKVGRIDLSKGDTSSLQQPSSRRSAQSGNPHSRPPRHKNTKAVRICLEIACYICAAASIVLLSFGIGLETGIAILVGSLLAAFVIATFVNTKNIYVRVVFLCIFIVLLVIGVSKTNYRKANRETFDFELAKARDTEMSYEDYIYNFPNSQYLQECKDSVESKKLQDILSYYSYPFTRHKQFIEDCESKEIRKRAIEALDECYAKMKYKSTEEIDAFKDFYCDVYPDGTYYDDFKSEMFEKLEKKAFDEAIDELTIEALNKYLKEYPDGAHAKAAREQIELLRQAAENAKYANNSLSTGSQPYANYYGRNGSGNCAVIVDASGSTDVVVIVKYNNSDGRVAGHAYIRRGSSYTIHLSPGTYQVFFYYGNGWNPNKKLSNGLTGGFTSSEQYGKDNPISLSYSYSGDYIYYDQMKYSLQSVVGGNFSMKGSNANDVF